jgi:hypothetical protein
MGLFSHKKGKSTDDIITDHVIDSYNDIKNDHFRKIDSVNNTHNNPYTDSLFRLIAIKDSIKEAYSENLRVIKRTNVFTIESTMNGDMIKESNRMNDYIYHTSDFSFVYNFAWFLDVAEELLLYNNCNSESIYSEFTDNDDVIIKFIDDDVNIGFSFSEVEDLDILNEESLSDYFESSNKPKSKNISCLVEVLRNESGKKTRFTLSSYKDRKEDINFTDDISKMLFDNILKIPQKKVDSAYRKIVKNFKEDYLSIHERKENSKK